MLKSMKILFVVRYCVLLECVCVSVCVWVWVVSVSCLYMRVRVCDLTEFSNVHG
jgi:hypothetical protein